MDIDIKHLREWIGKKEESRDLVTASPVDRLDRMLDRTDPPPAQGDPIAPLRSTLFFLPNAPQSQIGPDGHARRGGFLPPVPLPRRMFAGARYRFHAPLRIGDEVRREAEILDVTHKQGASGPLVFVTFRYGLYDSGGLCVEDERDVVYREEAPAGGDPASRKAPAAAPPARDFAFEKAIQPDPVMLFRYSALTYNGHRIHYDRSYVTECEGYPGLIVHGPLTALLLLELARDNTGDRPIKGFSFRARAPLFDVAPFTVGGRLKDDGSGCELEAVAPDGRTAMTAETEFAST